MKDYKKSVSKLATDTTFWRKKVTNIEIKVEAYFPALQIPISSDFDSISLKFGSNIENVLICFVNFLPRLPAFLFLLFCTSLGIWLIQRKIPLSKLLSSLFSSSSSSTYLSVVKHLVSWTKAMLASFASSIFFGFANYKTLSRLQSSWEDIIW